MTDTDTRRYEQAVHDAGASDYDKLVASKFQIKHKYFTTAVWGKQFNEPFLDYRCGTGIASCILADMGCKVVASDISSKMVAITEQKCNVPVVVADALHLPFKNQSFSTICITGVLHHILDLDSTFDEICRCAKEVICINEPSTTPPILPIKLIHTFVHIVGSLKVKLRGDTNQKNRRISTQSKYERPLDPNKLVQLCENHGFKIAKIRVFNHIPFLHSIPSERFKRYIFEFLISAKTGTHVEIIATRASLHMLNL